MSHIHWIDRTGQPMDLEEDLCSGIGCTWMPSPEARWRETEDEDPGPMMPERITVSMTFRLDGVSEEAISAVYGDRRIRRPSSPAQHLCDGCGRVKMWVYATEDGRAQLCGECTAVHNRTNPKHSSYCVACDMDVHWCPGCGMNLEHGRVVCKDCATSESE